MQDVLNQADQAMYRAKKPGRNQMRTAQEAEKASRHFALSVLGGPQDSRDGKATSSDGVSGYRATRWASCIHLCAWWTCATRR